MGGSNMYCVICGGPMCTSYSTDNLTKSFEFHEMLGVTAGDAQWIRTSVTVYADCISPRGEYDWGEYSIYPYSQQNKFCNHQPEQYPDPEDPVHVPDWASENQPDDTVAFSCHEEDPPPAHELCIRLAAEWSRARNPTRFNELGALGQGRTDASKFLWSVKGPTTPFFCDLYLADGFSEKSLAMRNKLGNPEKQVRVVTAQVWWSDSVRDTFGYQKVPAWRTGCQQDYEHEDEYGIQHLKRPDCFPDIHSVDQTPTISIQSLFPIAARGLPLEIVLHIVEDTGLDDDIFQLECLSRPWRDLFRTPLLQRQIWLKRVLQSGFTPTAADWTESAEKLRTALETDSNSSDWRRFFKEAKKSLNMKNRTRLQNRVATIDRHLGHCD